MNYRHRPQFPALPPERQPDAALDALRVTKRLRAGANGTARWTAQFGGRLVCVRYREDPRTGKRLTTVELIVDERPPKPSTQLLVKIKLGESGLRQRLKEYGAQWDADRELWRVSHQIVEALGLQERVVGKLPPMEKKG